MAVLTYAQIQNLVLDELMINVSTDLPIDTSAGGELERAINDAYQQIWESSGGTLTTATHGTLWNETVGSGTRTLTGKITTIEEIEHLWFTSTSGSVGGQLGDKELEPVELSRIQWLRTFSGSGSGLGIYANPVCFAKSKASTVTAANVNKWTVEFWPDATSVGFFPAHYMPQFSPIDAVTVTVPDCNDIQSRDIAHVTAVNLAPRYGRAEFIPSMAQKISEVTNQMLQRKASSLVDARQDQ